jgi:hypothetical protein
MIDHADCTIFCFNPIDMISAKDEAKKRFAPKYGMTIND